MAEIYNKVQYLIVDTSAFIKNAPLQDIAENIITEQDVVDEITSKRQLRRLVVLPYDLKIQTAFPENVKFVTEFAKKTGDYNSLSATDIKVIALTYQLEKEKVGSDHLKKAPTIAKTIDTSKKSSEVQVKPPVGFYVPQIKIDTVNGQECVQDVAVSKKEEIVQKIQNALREDAEMINRMQVKQQNPSSQLPKHDVESNDLNNAVSKHQEIVDKIQAALKEDADAIRSEQAKGERSSIRLIEPVVEAESDHDSTDLDVDVTETEELADKFAKLSCQPVELEVEDENGEKHSANDILAPITSKDLENHDNVESDEYKGDTNENDEDDDDDSSWITPSNIKQMKKQMDADILKEKPATVACVTTDFAMQNVLMQIGLNVASLDGRVIQQMRTFIFRCYACFKTTSVMTKVFCPNCGNKTLKKVAVSVDDSGKQTIHINLRKPLSARGKKFSLPMPQGGKHANNPILCEDQPMPHQRPSRLSCTKNDPLHEDYIAGYSPFIMRDVNSKSALLGIRPGSTVKQWMKRNPNESRKKRK